MGIIEVAAGESLLESYVKNPLTAMSELIWNALDADASEISITIPSNDLGGADEFVLDDNGTGMNALQAERAFGSVGDSWKGKPGALSERNKRPVHGKNGRGRYTAFSLGRIATWTTRGPAIVGTHTEEVTIAGNRDDLRKLQISEPRKTGSSTGTTLRVRELSQESQTKLLNDEVIKTHLITTFATHLQRYPDVSIFWNGKALDPSAVQLNVAEVHIEMPEGIAPNAEMTVIEWDLKNVPRRIFICEHSGVVLDDIAPGIQAPGAEFTAYLRWDGYKEDVTRLFLESGSDTESPGGKVLAAARKALKTHLNTRLRFKEKRLLEDWVNTGVYPYVGEPASNLERNERRTFEVVAMAASRTIEEAKSPRLKKLSLRLIKEALQSNPANLHAVLEQVLTLPAERVDELASLLNRTELSHVISSSHLVSGRMDFIQGLNALIFDKPSRKTTLERRQLHRILAQETWIFGEEWAITGDDQRLSEVLKVHLNQLGQDIDLASGPEPKREDGKIAIPDLVLGRARPTMTEMFEHLVVELKRPSHILNPNDLRQLEDYAHAITSDERFQQSNVQWEFWLVGNTTTPQLDEKRETTNMPYGQTISHKKYSIWVKTWAEIIGSAEHRHKFVQDSLKYNATRDSGLEALRKKHGKFLPPVLQVVADTPNEIEDAKEAYA